MRESLQISDILMGARPLSVQHLCGTEVRSFHGDYTAVRLLTLRTISTHYSKDYLRYLRRFVLVAMCDLGFPLIRCITGINVARF